MSRNHKARSLSLCLFIIVAFGIISLGQKFDKTPEKILLVNGRLINGTGEKAIENSLVIIEGNKITYAGKNKSKTPPGKKIDCTGKTILPGLFDAHIHLGAACTYGYIPLDANRSLSGFLYCGVTSVFDLANSEKRLFDLRDSERKGAIKSPRIFTVGPCFTCPKGHGTEYGVPDMAITPTTENEAREAVRRLAPKKPDLIKIIYEKGSRRSPSISYELMRAIIDESHKNNLKVITHISTLEQAKDAVKAGTDGLAHIMMDMEVDEALLNEMKKKNIFCTPTLSVWEGLFGSSLVSKRFLEWPLLQKGVCQEIVEDLKTKSKQEMFSKGIFVMNEYLSNAKANLKKMADAGITLALGTDAGNPVVFYGPSVHREMELMVEAGIPPLEVITIATKNAAEILDQADKLGTIEEGKLADILIAEGNPLDNIQNTQNIFMVIKNGEILDREKLAQEVNPPKKQSLPSQDLPALVDDFEDNNKMTKWETEWFILTDKVAGGSSTAEMEIISDGADSSKYALHVFGKNTTQRPYNFAGVIAPLGKTVEQQFDVSQYTGIKFKAKGDSKKYSLFITTAAVKDYDDFGCEFIAPMVWKEIVIPFTELKQFGSGQRVTWTAKDVRSLEFLSTGNEEKSFDFYIDNISFYKDIKDEEVKIDDTLIQKIKEAKSTLQKGMNKYDPEAIKNARESFLDFISKVKGENVYLLYYTALCDYRLAFYYLTANNKQEAEKYNIEGKEYLEKIMQKDPSFGEPYALYASMLACEIALHQERAMTLGMQIYTYFVKALEKDPDNPRVNLMKGISDFYTPEMYGGGADKAIQTLTKAVSFFEKEEIKDPLKPAWGYEEAYTFLGMAYKQKQELDKAKESFTKALEINPNFGMAKDALQKLEKQSEEK